MWIWIIRIGIGIIVIGAVIWVIYWLKKPIVIDKNLSLFHRCIHCGLPFIPPCGDYHLPTCPNCGQTTNISAQKPFSQNAMDRMNMLQSLDKSSPETLISFAYKLMSEGRYADAKKCLDVIGKFPDLDKETAQIVALMTKELEGKGY